MKNWLRTLSLVVLLVSAGSLAARPTFAADAPSISDERQVQAERAQIREALKRIEKAMDDLPEAAASLRPVEADLRRRLVALEGEPGRSEGKASPDETQHRRHKRPPRRLNLTLDTRLGFDRDSIMGALVDEGAHVQHHDGGGEEPMGALHIDVKRVISSTTLLAEYPLTDSTRMVLLAPWTSQSAELNVAGRKVNYSGSGLGDVSLFLERRFPEIFTGTELSLGLGVQLPTGRDTFETGKQELPTGVGFVQPRLRVGMRKLLAPVELFGAFEYSTSLSRSIDGKKMRLPAGYGGEFGFSYMISPEFMSTTSVSLRQVSSPVLLGPDMTEGYLSQALVYRAGGKGSFRGSVDVGLTRDSVDLWVGLAYRREF